MKKRILAMVLSILSLMFIMSCGSGNSDTGSNQGGENGGNSSQTENLFDPNNVTMLSAYSQAQYLGFCGTLDEFIALISGKDGAPGKDGVDGTVVEISEDGYWVIDGVKTEHKAIGVDGAPGKDGTDGKPGANGEKGDTGATIKKVEFDEQGRLVITLTNDTVLDPIELPKKEEHSHTFGEWLSFSATKEEFCENRIFHRACTECSVIELKTGTYENHDFETITTPPTCQSGGYDTKICSICGKVETVNETDVSDHSWKEEYSSDNSFHWFECKNCNAISSKAEHSIGESGFCTECDAPLAPTEGIIYDMSADGTYAEVIAYSGDAKRVIISDTYNGVPVKSIYNEAFENSDITAVVIPDSVTSIKASAFYSCNSLTSVTIGDSVTSIGNYAFNNCSSLTSVTIGNSVTWIGEDAFGDCTALTSVTIPDSVTSIGSSAFSGCSSLTSVTIGNSVTSIGYGAFRYCRSLTSINLPDTITRVGGSAFSGCDSSIYTEYGYCKYVGNSTNPYAILIGTTNENLSTYTIHEDTKIIADSAFKSCTRLSSITIPNSVTSIGSSAFYNCTGLTSIKYRGTETQWLNIEKGWQWDDSDYLNAYDGYQLIYTMIYNYTGD